MSFAATYQQLIADGKLAPDQDQAKAVEALDLLSRQLIQASSPRGGSLLNRLRRSPPTHTSQLGLYLWGSVGSGKTRILDLFFNQLPLKKKSVTTSTTSWVKCMLN